MRFLTYDEFCDTVLSLEGDGHWTSELMDDRWSYHAESITILERLKLDDPTSVLEVGTMGAPIVSGSDTLDLADRWDFPGKNPTITHDARDTPWPIQDEAYEVLVALRVYQHLAPSQKEATAEAFRVAKRVLIVVDQHYENPVLPDSKGISRDAFIRWVGRPPDIESETGKGTLFFWDVKPAGLFNRLRQRLSGTS